MTLGDTIVAISSAVGEAARIIVRLSGPNARSITDSLSRRPGRFSDQGSVERCSLLINELPFQAWVYSFMAPKSYTGEDLVELHLPGNPLLARMTLAACQHAGARLAEAGEFTARAYFNGRLDLSEAEGVAATIAAHGEAELAAARQLLGGELSKRLRPAMELLADTLALVEVGIDFVEEDVTFLSAEQIGDRLDRIDGLLANLQSTAGRFERLTHEPRVVLVGPPNVGKSTLLNLLAGQTRAVVSSIAGTTRDALSATVFLRRGAIELFDVAGIEALNPAATGPQQEIDRQMQAQARQAIETADVLVQVCDATQPSDMLPLDREADLTIFTKADLVVDFLTATPQSILISAVTGDGIDLLRQQLDAIAFGSETPNVTLSLTARHWQAIDTARASLSRARQHAALEVVASELRESLDALGQILGVIAPDELLGRIFSAFCIGK